MPYSVKDILQMEIAPALGCTEPSAIAFGAAAAASLLENKSITSIEVWVDVNIFKNSLAVTIPGTDGLHGLDVASALGAVGGDPSLKLQVLEPVNDQIIAHVQKIVQAGQVKVNLLPDQKGIYIRTQVIGINDVAESIIMDSHDNIVSLKINDQTILDHPLLLESRDGDSQNELMEMESWLKTLSLADLYGLIDDLDMEDFAFLEEGIQYNLRLADYGLKYGPGLGVGKTLDTLVRQRLIKKDMILAAKILTSSAADARMAGVKIPAMSLVGSGNLGLTAILPIWAVKDYIECDERVILEAVALSYIITIFIKAHTGRLSAICGSSIAAGAGATAGITHLLGGGLNHIAGAIKNLTGDLAGVICDGAKAGCALKLSTAAGTAVQAALFAIQGVQVHSSNGIIATSQEGTMHNVGILSTQGMIETDRTILQIMMEKQFSSI
ncbi:serine dehydratase subunit alpha family protein [Chloroflexota bacterium]